MVTIHGISILVYFGLGCPWFPHSSNYMDLSWGGTIHTISHVHFLWRVGNAVHSLVKCISVCVQQSSATAGNGCHQPSTSAEISNEGRHALKSWSWDFWWFLSPNHQKKHSFSEDVWARFNASLKDLKVLEPNVLWELLPKSETRMTRNIMVLVATRSQRCLFNDRRIHWLQCLMSACDNVDDSLSNTKGRGTTAPPKLQGRMQLFLTT